ncbi:MAG: 50S ribosomal protein L29 [Candidatus Diapherotrites archaeon]
MSSKKVVSELRESGVEELEDMLLGLKTSLAKEKALVASGTRPEKPATIRGLRRKIARIITIAGEKKKGAVDGKKAAKVKPAKTKGEEK